MKDHNGALCEVLVNDIQFITGLCQSLSAAVLLYNQLRLDYSNKFSYKYYDTHSLAIVKPSKKIKGTFQH